MKPLHKILHDQRKKLGLTQTQTAKLAGISQPMLSNFEQGREATISTAQLIADALDMRITAIPKNTTQTPKHFIAEEPSIYERASLLERYNIKDDD